METQLLIAKNIGYLDEETHNYLYQLVIGIERQLCGFIKRIRNHKINEDTDEK